ncbi:hypothetical protein HUU05_23870, partial [candidate division KSB1 bacterium]|nr:hypothetical protein [candidate division KSB1 bacterium]
MSLKVAAYVLGAFLLFRTAPAQEQTKLVKIEEALKPEIPRVLCLNENIATGAQPKNDAFAKLAQSGFRSVLSLRTENEGVDLKKDRELTEAAGMQYLHIPIVSAAPDTNRIADFINAVDDPK